MGLDSDDPWRDEWLNKPFQLPVFDSDGQQACTAELEFIQLKTNECVLLVRTERMVLTSYSVDGKKFRTVQKVAYVDFNCFGTLLKLRGDLEVDGHVIGCNGARDGFEILKGQVAKNYGLGGHIGDENTAYSERKDLPMLTTFEEFSDVSKLNSLAQRQAQYLQPKTT